MKNKSRIAHPKLTPTILWNKWNNKKMILLELDRPWIGPNFEHVGYIFFTGCIIMEWKLTFTDKCFILKWLINVTQKNWVQNPKCRVNFFRLSMNSTECTIKRKLATLVICTVKKTDVWSGPSCIYSNLLALKRFFHFFEVKKSFKTIFVKKVLCTF